MQRLVLPSSVCKMQDVVSIAGMCPNCTAQTVLHSHVCGIKMTCPSCSSELLKTCTYRLQHSGSLAVGLTRSWKTTPTCVLCTRPSRCVRSACCIKCINSFTALHSKVAFADRLQHRHCAVYFHCNHDSDVDRARNGCNAPCTTL